MRILQFHAFQLLYVSYSVYKLLHVKRTRDSGLELALLKRNILNTALLIQLSKDFILLRAFGA